MGCTAAFPMEGGTGKSPIEPKATPVGVRYTAMEAGGTGSRNPLPQFLLPLEKIPLNVDGLHP